MSLTKYGFDTIKAVTAICCILIVIAVLFDYPWLRFCLFLITAIVMIFTINFFRDPERLIPVGQNQIVSPADGKVIVIKSVQEEKFLKSAGTQISVFMSPLNVHVNRIPYDGKIGYLRYIRGKFLPAFQDKACEENERSEIGIETELGKILFTQVAGYVARRIVFDLKEGQAVKKGERFGMIKFGSRVDIIVPASWKVKVKEGDIVRAGETVLFSTTEE